MNDTPSQRILSNAKFILARITTAFHGRSLTPDEWRLVQAYEKLINDRKEVSP